MNPGDLFYCEGNWNTEPGWWRVTVPDAGCGMTKAAPVQFDSAGESEWFTDYVERRIEAAAKEAA